MPELWQATLSHFFMMGGYGIYIWLAYGIVLTMLLVNFLIPWRQLRTIQKQKIQRQTMQSEKITNLSSNAIGEVDASNS